MVHDAKKINSVLREALAAQVEKEMAWISTELETVAKAGRSRYVILKKYNNELYQAVRRALEQSGFRVQDEESSPAETLLGRGKTRLVVYLDCFSK